MNVNVHVFICDVIVYIACHLPLTHLLGIIVQFNKFYSILFYSIVQSNVGPLLKPCTAPHRTALG